MAFACIGDMSIPSVGKIMILLMLGVIGVYGQMSSGFSELSIDNQVSIANDGYVNVDDLGDYYNGPYLLCHTDNVQCCSRPRQGEWYFPNGTAVGNFGSKKYDRGLNNFFARRRGPSVVHLFRDGTPSERGRFHCEIPKADGVYKTVYANILDIGTVTMTTIDTVGDIFTLECSVDITPNPLPPNVPAPSFEWFFGPANSSLPPGVTVSNVTNSGNTYTSTLQFSPLMQCHAGMYTCQLGGNERLTAISMITVNGPESNVRVTGDDTDVVAAGQSYTLTCTFIGSLTKTNVGITYQWKKDGVVMPSETESTLSFSSIKLSDAGRYTCEVTVDSLVYCGAKDISLQIPVPVLMTVTSFPGSPVRPVGSDVTLICTVELSQTVDVPVTVSAQLTDPAGSPLPTTTSSTSGSIYNSTAMISSFGRNQSGDYTCAVMLTSSSSFLMESGTLSDEVRVTTGVYLSLGETVGLENNTCIPITDIGTSSPQQLVCTSDRKPCCQDHHHYGEWKFPNGSQVKHLEEGAVAFHSIRDNNGNVNLYRVSGDVELPGGRTCCEIPDSYDANQTLCVDIVPLVSIEINDGGATPTVGEIYAITCNVSGANPTTYQWKKDGIVLSEKRSIISFSPLRLSDVGLYTCEVTLYSCALTRSHQISLTIPLPPSINLKSSKPNPIRPVGSEVTLTCTVELSPLVDIPVTVNTVWTGPDESMTHSDTTQSIRNTTNYTSTAIISSFGRHQSGNYTCTVTVSSATSTLLTNSTGSAVAEVTVGVYLSKSGKMVPLNGTLFITDIGTSSQQLVCTSDRKPCCRELPQYGEWKLPDGSQIKHINERPTAFHRNRDNSGHVNLFRVSSDVMSPTGIFCCEIADANDMNHTLCVNISSPVTAEITEYGIPTAGQSYSLTCTVTGAENLNNAIIMYQWTKNNGTRAQFETNASTLFFSPLRLSDAGEYSCDTTVTSSSLIEDVTASFTYSVIVSIPHPTVRLVSDTPNPILSGTSPSLTCSVELSPSVDVPLTINTVWSGPDNMILTSATPPVAGSLTHYTSTAVLSSVESADSGEYSCTVNIGSDISISARKSIFVGDGMFQLRLTRTVDCHLWASTKATSYRNSIEEALVEAIERRCKCHFPKANLFKESFSCDNSPNSTTYRNTLIGTHNFNATQLIGFIQNWVTSGPKIKIDWYTVRVDSSCPVAIASLEEPECDKH